MKMCAKDFINKICDNIYLFMVKRYLENIYKRQILVFFLNMSLRQAFEIIMKEWLIRKGNLNVRLHTLFLFLTKIK